jgi:hypothetical protein
MAEFNTKEECDTWVLNHKLKGKDRLVKKSKYKEDGYSVLFEDKKEDGQIEYVLEGKCEYKVEYIMENPVTLEEHKNALKAYVKNVLLDTDWTQISDANITTEKRNLYRKYRDYVRNVHKQYDDVTIKNWKVLSYKEYVNKHYPK